jgi:tRNA pseudouridine38-40 synthase
MPRYKILIEYDGTRYSGWQRQPNANTVEEEVENALSQILREPVNIIGQGRTDAGVHAEGQVAHFDFPKELDKHRLLFGLLGVLPGDIAVWDMEGVDSTFHARFYGKARQYRYQVITRPSPLWNNYAEMILGDLDLNKMKECSDMIEGTHDFESFTHSSEEQPRTSCDIMLSRFDFGDPLITYRIKANRFLRHMVRRLVGTMLQVGQGKMNVKQFSDFLHKPSKNKNGHGASAKGLILEKVEY